MKRRTFLAGLAGAGLARPALAQPEGARKLIFVPQANLTSLDPVWTTATVTRNFAFLVYETLYGLDAQLQPQPQMAEGHTIDDDGRRWTITLREGLRFHDNTPVLARDCAASLARWMKRDSLGQTLAARLDALVTPDDRTLVFRLKTPFPPLAFALGKVTPNPPVIMPGRIAATNAFQQVKDVVGSGPFQFVAGEYVSGSLAVFARNDAYVPRQDAPSFAAGARRALVDRVEWRIIPDAATAAGALQSGEVDWLEMPIPDLLATLRANRDIVVDRLDPYGLYPVLRPNCLQAPTSDPAIRRAILAAVDPVEVMQALMGDDREAWTAPIGCFLPGTESANSAAMDRVGGKREPAALKSMLKDAGYDGARVVLMHTTDQPFYDTMSSVVASSLGKAGFTVDDEAMDFGTVVQRRAKKDPLDAGGWSLFCTSFPALDYLDPLVAPALRGNGANAWYGWPDEPKLESLRDAWIDSPDPATRKSLAAQIQTEAFTQAVVIPLGQYRQSAAWRRTLSGHLKGPVPLFWNVSKA